LLSVAASFAGFYMGYKHACTSYNIYAPSLVSSQILSIGVGKLTRYTNSTKLEIANNPLPPGSYASSVACAESLYESKCGDG